MPALPSFFAAAWGRAPQQRGITLLEMLVALSIMALSITLIYRAVAGSLRGVEQAEQHQQAAWLMQSLLDASSLVDPAQLAQSGQEGALAWTLQASPDPVANALAQQNAGQQPPELYRVDIQVQHLDSGRQWQLHTLRPLLLTDEVR